MSKTLQEVLDANAAYADEFAKSGKAALPMPPRRRFAILTCMDARLDPAAYAGLVEGDAHVVRNAGGRATDDAIRSLIISTRLLGTREFLVVHHTTCGMLLFNDDVMTQLTCKSIEPHTYPDLSSGEGPGATEARYIKWHTFSDADAAVRDDVHRIANHPLISKSVKIYGFIFDCATGKLNAVDGATRA